MHKLRCEKYLTTQRADYAPFHTFERTVRCPKKEQADEALITGHDFNNLMVKKRQQVSKTWPHSMDRREEYRQFLLRLKMCDPEKYRLFECPKVKYSFVEKMMKEKDKTIYGLSYSPNKNLSLRSQKTIDCGTHVQSRHFNYYTTYADYYNRISSEDCFIDATLTKRPANFRSGLEVYEEVLRKYFRKYNETTYTDTICLPALVLNSGKVSECYLDRYSRREV